MPLLLLAAGSVLVGGGGFAGGWYYGKGSKNSEEKTKANLDEAEKTRLKTEMEREQSVNNLTASTHKHISQLSQLSSTIQGELQTHSAAIAQNSQIISNSTQALKQLGQALNDITQTLTEETKPFILELQKTFAELEILHQQLIATGTNLQETMQILNTEMSSHQNELLQLRTRSAKDKELIESLAAKLKKATLLLSSANSSQEVEKQRVENNELKKRIAELEQINTQSTHFLEQAKAIIKENNQELKEQEDVIDALQEKLETYAPNREDQSDSQSPLLRYSALNKRA